MARYGQLTRRTAGLNIHLMSSPSPSIGQILGHYRILEQIGAGGMGVVYRAHDERLDRDVAIKVLPPGAIADEAARKRFRKEALTLSKLSHPNIAMVFDFDTQDGMDFLVTEYIRGTTMDASLGPGFLPEKQVLQLGLQLAEGLGAAHGQGVVHRDLKPSNLRITPDGRLKILDFGIAKLSSMFDVEACSMVGAVRRVTARLLFLHCQADPGGITVSGSGISRYSRPPRREYDEN